MLVWILQVSEGLIIRLHVHVGTICNLKEYLKKVVMLITVLFIFSYFVIWIANTKANFLMKYKWMCLMEFLYLYR